MTALPIYPRHIGLGALAVVMYVVGCLNRLQGWELICSALIYWLVVIVWFAVVDDLTPAEVTVETVTLEALADPERDALVALAGAAEAIYQADAAAYLLGPAIRRLRAARNELPSASLPSAE